ncbi:hypothetical protein GGI21_003527, partial [Coemansia aciculifera]
LAIQFSRLARLNAPTLQLLTIEYGDNSNDDNSNDDEYINIYDSGVSDLILDADGSCVVYPQLHTLRLRMVSGPGDSIGKSSRGLHTSALDHKA